MNKTIDFVKKYPAQITTLASALIFLFAILKAKPYINDLADLLNSPETAEAAQQTATRAEAKADDAQEDVDDLKEEWDEFIGVQKELVKDQRAYYQYQMEAPPAQNMPYYPQQQQPPVRNMPRAPRREAYPNQPVQPEVWVEWDYEGWPLCCDTYECWPIDDERECY